MKYVLNILVVMTLLAVSVTAMAAQPKISLKSRVQVRSDGMVRVCDIATVQGTAVQKKTIGEAVVLIAPKPGCVKTVEADYIKRKLEAIRIKDVIMQGAPEITIEGECIRLEPADLLDQARTFLTSLLPVLTNGTYNITVVREPEELVIPTGTKVETSPKLMFSEPRIGINYVLIDAKVDGKVVGTGRVQLKAVVMVEALTASSTIRKGDVIGTHNTSLRQVEATQGKDYLGSDLLNGQEPVVSSRTIMPGAVICSGDVTSQLAVKKGDIVTLVVRCGNVKLATAAEAKESGCRGASVTVRSDISSSDVRARIIEPGLVEIKR